MKHIVHFSGKRSSAYLAQLLLSTKYSGDVELVFVDSIAITASTLSFIQDFERNLGVNITILQLTSEDDYDVTDSLGFSPKYADIRVRDCNLLINQYVAETYGNTPYIQWLGITKDENQVGGYQYLSTISDYTQSDVVDWWNGNDFNLKDSAGEITKAKLIKLTDKQKMQQRQSLPLDSKIQMTKGRVRQWYDYYDGNVYLSFSGGKDSNVLAHIIRSMPFPYNTIPMVFVNTGLEFPEVLNHVRGLKESGWNIEQIKPLRTFKDIWDNDGIPLVSKRVARQIRIARGELGGEQSRNLVLNGIKRDGTPTKSQWRMSEKWKYLIDTDVKISDTCCDYLKKKPFIRYEKESGRRVMTAMMADEGGTREMIQKCNMFDGSRPKSSPMLFWKESDVWEYVERFNVDLAAVYYDREYNFEGQKVCIKGEKRTGCMFCAFGQHLVKDDLTKFQKMQVTHPRQYNVIINRMGLDKALDLVGVKYKFEIPIKNIDVNNQQELFKKVS